jgi:putative heme iron utilization protein
MDPNVAQGVRTLLEGQRVASLGTLHDGEPHVSMVPFAMPPGEIDFVIHVSGLAAHTRDMLAEPRVSLLVMAANPEVQPQATARMTVQGDATRIEPDSEFHAAAKKAYLARFPESEMIFNLGDFSLFAIRPRAIRFVGGFAQAKTITPEGLAGILR